MRALPIIPPIRGLNTVNPYIEYDSGYARELTNYFMTGGSLRMRPSVKDLYTSSSASVLFHHYLEYGIASNGDIYDIDTNAVLGTIGGSVNKRAGTYCKHMSLDFVFGAREPRIVASPFTAWTFTTGTITATNIIDGCSHKGRLFVADSTTIEFSSIAQITGAMTGSSNLSAFLDGQEILRIFSITLRPGDETESVFIVFADGGKVLIFAGDFPTASNWRLVGKYNMTSPIVGGLGFVEIDGDIFVAGQKYCYMALDLIKGGLQLAYENRLTRDIENLWQNQNWYLDLSDETAHAFYLDKDYTSGISYNCIIIQCAQSDVDFVHSRYHNEVIYFVYNRTYKHWSVWGMPPLYAPVRIIDNVARGTNGQGAISYIGYDSLVEDYYIANGVATPIDIVTSWKTPYTSPYQGKFQKLHGIRPYFKNTSSGYFFKVRAIYDYSDLNFRYGFYTQPGSAVEVSPGKYQDGALDMAANSYYHYQTFKSIGGKGSGLSFQFSQMRKFASADAHEHEIYASNAYISDGGVVTT